MQIDGIVLDVLGNSIMEGNTLKLTGTLDRNLYISVNRVLEAAGGKWNRRAQAHVFDDEAADIMDTIILTGTVVSKKQEFQQFFTPKPIVDRLIQISSIEPGMLVLEPSAGDGAIAVEVAKLGAIVHCFEIDEKLVNRLAGKLLVTVPSYNVTRGDFMSAMEEHFRDPFDRVVMNPPFTRQQDIKHVMQAFRFLAPGGKLAAIMSVSITFRTDKVTQQFRKVIDLHNGTIEVLPENAFASSGTNVNTVLVTMEK